MEPKPLAALMNTPPVATLTGETQTLHQRILQLKSQPKTLLTADELDRIALRICAESGIKELPGEEIIDLCLKSWADKFSAQMNRQELELAFDMNVNGDLPEKVVHYQCFSREYFCNVLNAYLEARRQANIKTKQVTLRSAVKEDTLPSPPPDYGQHLMEALITDRKLVATGKEPELNFTIVAKLDRLSQLFEIKLVEKTINTYRNKAAGIIIVELIRQKNIARLQQKFGRELDLLNQITRLRAGKLLTEKDETMIRLEVSKMIYYDELLRWEEGEFVEHVKSQMALGKFSLIHFTTSSPTSSPHSYPR